MSDDDGFRALLICTVCGNVIVTGPWTTGDRAMAAYHLGRAPAGSVYALDHLQVAGHALTVTFESRSMAIEQSARTREPSTFPVPARRRAGG